MAQGGASGLLCTHPVLLLTAVNQGQEQAQPKMAPAPRGMMSLHGGQVGFSGGAGGVWWAVEEEGWDPGPEGGDPAVRMHPGEQGEIPGEERGCWGCGQRDGLLCCHRPLWWDHIPLVEVC